MKFSHDVDYAREAAQKAKRFYSADAIGRLDIQIANVQERAATPLSPAPCGAAR
jgi:hypothetical protein